MAWWESCIPVNEGTAGISWTIDTLPSLGGSLQLYYLCLYWLDFITVCILFRCPHGMAFVHALPSIVSCGLHAVMQNGSLGFRTTREDVESCIEEKKYRYDPGNKAIQHFEAQTGYS